jgi:hypothetical protein
MTPIRIVPMSCAADLVSFVSRVLTVPCAMISAFASMAIGTNGHGDPSNAQVPALALGVQTF